MEARKCQKLNGTIEKLLFCSLVKWSLHGLIKKCMIYKLNGKPHSMTLGLTVEVKNMKALDDDPVKCRKIQHYSNRKLALVNPGQVIESHGKL